LFSTALLQAVTIEERGGAAWPTRNHFRWIERIEARAGTPVLVSARLSRSFAPDSLRVLGPTSALIPSKLEWHIPEVKISWISQGPGSYAISFDGSGGGETERLVAPAMVGTGDRITFGRPGVRGRLSVGLWAHPVALDFDGDGNIDMIVSCLDHRYNGIYLFTILGQIKSPYSIGPSGWHRERRTSPSAEGRVIGPAGES